MAFSENPFFFTDEILSGLRGQMQSKVESVLTTAHMNHNTPEIRMKNNEVFKDLLSNGRISNYVFFHKVSEPDSLIIRNQAHGQKHTVDFHCRISQHTENNHDISLLNNVLCKHRRAPLMLKNVMYKDACSKLKGTSTVDRNVLNFYNQKLTNVVLSDGTTIQSAVRRGRFVQNAMVFSIECKTTGKKWTGLLPTKIKPGKMQEINNRALLNDVCPYIRRFMQMTNETYIKEMKGVSEDTFHQMKVVGELPEPVVYEVRNELQSIDEQCHLLSAKIHTTLATSHLNKFCPVDTFPFDQAMDYDASVLILA